MKIWWFVVRSWMMGFGGRKPRFMEGLVDGSVMGFS